MQSFQPVVLPNGNIVINCTSLSLNFYDEEYQIFTKVRNCGVRLSLKNETESAQFVSASPDLRFKTIENKPNADEYARVLKLIEYVHTSYPTALILVERDVCRLFSSKFNFLVLPTQIIIDNEKNTFGFSLNEFITFATEINDIYRIIDITNNKFNEIYSSKTYQSCVRFILEQFNMQDNYKIIDANDNAVELFNTTNRDLQFLKVIRDDRELPVYIPYTENIVEIQNKTYIIQSYI